MPRQRRPVALLHADLVTDRRFLALGKEKQPDACVDALTDEFGNVLGPSWAEMTGRHVEDLQIEFTTDEPARPAA